MNCNIIPEEQTWTYEIEKPNTGIININDALLKTDASTEERARSEFLKNAYIPKEVSFETYLVDLNVNDVINLGGLPYLIKNITMIFQANILKSTIRAIRYE